MACLLIACLALLAGVAYADLGSSTGKATGLVVAPTPNIAAPQGGRYKGPLNSDPQARPQVQGLYEVLAQQSLVVAVHLAHVPQTDKFLYMERPSEKRSQTRQIAGTFDLSSRAWTPVDSYDGLFCSGQTITSEGEIVVVGGHKATGGYADGMRSVRIFSQQKGPTILTNATWMQWKRWYATATLLPDKQILIMGGTQQVGGSSGGNKMYELYKPDSNPNQYPLPSFAVEPGFVAQMKKMFYPFNFVLPTGEVFSFGERQGRILIAQTGKYRTNPDGTYMMGPLLPGNIFTQYPFTASAAYGGLTPDDNYSSIKLMIFGGAPTASVNNISTMAGRQVRTLAISWKQTATGWNYTFASNWTIEDLGISRVMTDATLLPNGDVVLTGGAQQGCAGDSSTTSGSGGKSDYPALWAQLYQPDQPLGKRVSFLAGSTIARMYHGTSVLTANATLLIAGCDRCYRLNSDVPSYVSPTSRWEYRNEIFYPPYWYDMANKPKIIQVHGGITTIGYGASMSLTWTSEQGNDVPVTSVSLVAPSATTHSWNFNQRVVLLKILSVNYSTNTIEVQTPPNPYIAPPQWYMVFAMNGKTMSRAKWIKLVDTNNQGTVVPK